jgi:diaminopimelate decarboxylase
MWKIETPLKNLNGKLFFANVSTSKLASKFGTPVFVTDSERIIYNYERLYSAFSSHYDKFKINYAVKANNNLSILKLFNYLGSGVDCSCPEEIFLAKKMGFSSKDILYTGNYNSNDQLSYALKQKTIINIDSSSILPRLLKLGTPNFISLRINPGIGGGSHSGLVFGGKHTKFGMSRKDAIHAYNLAKKSGVKQFGIHMMTGSSILDSSYFKKATNKLIDIAVEIVEECKISIDFINIGGGFGIPYKPPEKSLDIKKVGSDIGKIFNGKKSSKILNNPWLFVEPGRYLVADSTILLTNVHSIKSGPEKYVGIDAGMNTLLRPALYDAYHHIVNASRLNSRNKEIVNICGQICENTDILAKNRKLGNIKEGDLLAILNVGAYGFSMSSQYNTRPRAAEVMISKKNCKIIRQRETINDLINGQKVVTWFK